MSDYNDYNDFDNPILDAMDIDDDGYLDIGEKTLALDMFDIFSGDDYQQYVDMGLEYDLIADEYDDFQDYLTDLQNAIAEAEEACNTFVADDADEYEEPNEEDYPNKRRYEAAKELFFWGDSDCDESRICHFILEKCDELIAANYMTVKDFLFAQAIKDHFTLPIALPDEDEKSKMKLKDILLKLNRKDEQLTFEVWDWCTEHFLPYADYIFDGRRSITGEVFYHIGDFTEKFRSIFIGYFIEHPEFRKRVIREAERIPYELTYIIFAAFQNNLPDIAKAMFEDALICANNDWQEINGFIDDMLFWLYDYEDLELIKFIEDEFIAILNEYKAPMIKEEIGVWKEKLAELKERLLPEEDEYLIECARRRDEESRKESEKRLADNNSYIYCGVKLSFADDPYYFRTDDTNIKLWDIVMVPFGKEDAKMLGTVVSVGQYTNAGAPLPVEKTKKIIKKMRTEDL